MLNKMVKPPVTVVCLCYNQSAFVREAVESILSQDYEPIEIWLADDASSDNSQNVCRQLAEEYPRIQLSLNPANLGHCATFNTILSQATGKYTIDLAADDILLPDRISHGVNCLEKEEAGVNFSNACYIDEQGQRLHDHYPVDKFGSAIQKVPDGDLYSELVRRYFINPATMMFRTSLLDDLGGYDENLSYEDFDIWIRSARVCRYVYTNKILVKKRIHPNNYSLLQYRHGSIQMRDTYRVCQKIKQLNRTKDERDALRQRIRWEMKLCLGTVNLKLFGKYARLLSGL